MGFVFYYMQIADSEHVKLGVFVLQVHITIWCDSLPINHVHFWLVLRSSSSRSCTRNLQVHRI